MQLPRHICRDFSMRLPRTTCSDVVIIACPHLLLHLAWLSQLSLSMTPQSHHKSFYSEWALGPMDMLPPPPPLHSLHRCRRNTCSCGPLAKAQEAQQQHEQRHNVQVHLHIRFSSQWQGHECPHSGKPMVAPKAVHLHAACRAGRCSRSECKGCMLYRP